MMHGWHQVTVANLVAPVKNALVGGPFGSNLVSTDYVPQGIPVIRGENLAHGRWVGGEFVYVTPAKAESLSGNLARPGDIVFTQRGTLGQVAIVPVGHFNAYLISQSQMKLTPDETKADALFLFYVFTSPEQQDYVRRHAIQTGVPHTNLGILRSAPIALPSIGEQRAIAGVLGALDDKIELNRRMNETLEATARAIFKSWFVDFDPVHAKVGGRQPTGMSADVATLFPSTFQNAGVAIPSGWRVVKFGEIAAASREVVNPSECPDEIFDHYSIPAFDAGRSPVQELGSAIKSNKFLVAQNTVLLSKLNPRIPRIWIPELATAQRAICSTEFLALRPIAVSREYLYGLCSSQDFLEEFAMMVTGTSGSHQRVKSEFVQVMKVVMPDRAVVSSYTELVAGLHQHVAKNQGENHTLSALRDTLLPKLMSGEIRVRQAEKLAGAAL